jgi:hypothetical protein
MDKSHWGGGRRGFAHKEWRKQARWAVRQMGVEGEGRVFTRAEVQVKARRHDQIARAVDLEMLLLRIRQHEIATRALWPRQSKRKPRFLVAGSLKRGRPEAAR